MKAFDDEEKKEILFRFGAAIYLATKDDDTSIRELSRQAGMEFEHIRRIIKGDRNFNLFSLVAVSNAIKVPLSNLFLIYENLTKEQLLEYRRHREEEEKQKSQKKKKKL